MWSNYDELPKLLAEAKSHRQLKAKSGFLMQRTIPTVADGLALGLKPVSDNPIVQAQAGYEQVLKWALGEQIMKTTKEAGLLKFVRSGERAPDGWKRLNDPIARVVFRQETTKVSGEPGAPQTVLAGEYWGHPDAVKAIEKFTSPALWGFEPYGWARRAANVMTQAKLSLSWFHALFTAMNSGKVSDTTAILKFINERDAGAIGELAGNQIPLKTQVQDVFRGAKLRQEYTRPGAHPELASNVENIVEGGGRVGMEQLYTNRAMEKAAEHFRKGRVLHGVADLPMAAAEAVVYPVMRQQVPLTKLAALDKLNERTLAEHPNSTPEELREAFGYNADFVDNVFGQVIYDNQFQHAAIKGIAQVEMTAYGWFAGNIKLLAGAARDTGLQAAGKMGKDVPIYAKGLTPNQAYVLTEIGKTALINGIMTYALTRTMPKGLDYLAFRTGGKNPDGTDERILPRSYAYDWYNYAKNPVATMKGKQSAFVQTVQGLLTNRDWKGDMIVDPDNPLAQQFHDIAAYAIGQMVPISVIAQQKAETTAAKVGALVGANKAPKVLTNTPALNYINQRLDQIGGRTALTPGQQRDKTTVNKLARDARAGVKNDEAVQKAIDDGLTTWKKFQAQVQRGEGYPTHLIDMLKNKDRNGVYTDRVRAYSLMEPWEKEIFESEYDPQTGEKRGSGKSGSSVNIKMPGIRMPKL
jgi:hypothetical protein